MFSSLQIITLISTVLTLALPLGTACLPFVHYKTAWLADCALDVTIDWTGRVQESKHNTSRNKDRPVVSSGTNFQREIIDYIYHTPMTLDKVDRRQEVWGSWVLKIRPM